MLRRTPNDDSDIWPDNAKEWAVALLFLCGFLFSLYVWLFHPGLLVVLRHDLWGLVADSDQQPPVAEDQPLLLAVNDSRYLNRRFEESTFEQAYCGLINEEGVVRPWQANIHTANESSVQFSVENCPRDRYAGFAFIHTHPSGYPTPSDKDRRTMSLVDAAYLCIQTGPITTEVGRRTERLRCYSPADITNVANGTLTEVPVRIIPCRTCRVATDPGVGTSVGAPVTTDPVSPPFYDMLRRRPNRGQRAVSSRP